MPPSHSGYPFDYLVIAAGSGSLTGWACTYRDEVATCEVAPPDDVLPLATLVTSLEGAPSWPIFLRDDEGTTWDSVTAGTAERQLTFGRWELNAASSGSLGCSVRFQATPGARIVSLITIVDGAPCRIEVTRPTMITY